MKGLLTLLLLLFLTQAFAQTDTLPSKYLSLGSKTTGISFGNSPVYTGLRFNLIDKNVGRLDFINFGILKAMASKSNGLSISLGINEDSCNNGITIATLFNDGYKRNGIAISGLFTISKKINGLGIAGLGVMGDTLNGVFISAYGVVHWNPDREIKKLNGLAIAFVGVSAAKLNGVAISIINGTNQHYGLSIGLYNYTKKLRGVQFGLINYVGNNPKGLRWLPLINMHLGK